MSKFYNIKWRSKDEREARRIIRNFNDKLRREIAKNPRNKPALPQFFNPNTGEFESRLTFQNFKNMVETRADYNRELNALKRFSKRGAESIIDLPGNYNEARTTRWQLQELSRRTSIINQKRQARLDKKATIEMLDTLGKTGYTYGQALQMGLIQENVLKPTTAYTEGMQQGDIKRKYRSLMIESQQKYYNKKDLQLKENFIKGLQDTWKESEIREIVAKIRAMDPEEFLEKFDAKADNAFQDIYFPNAKQRKDYLNELKRYWLDIQVTTD
jgi:hypothetical protein